MSVRGKRTRAIEEKKASKISPEEKKIYVTMNRTLPDGLQVNITATCAEDAEEDTANRIRLQFARFAENDRETANIVEMSTSLKNMAKRVKLQEETLLKERADIAQHKEARDKELEICRTVSKNKDDKIRELQDENEQLRKHPSELRQLQEEVARLKAQHAEDEAQQKATREAAAIRSAVAHALLVSHRVVSPNTAAVVVE